MEIPVHVHKFLTKKQQAYPFGTGIILEMNQIDLIPRPQKDPQKRVGAWRVVREMTEPKLKGKMQNIRPRKNRRQRPLPPWLRQRSRDRIPSSGIQTPVKDQPRTDGRLDEGRGGKDDPFVQLSQIPSAPLRPKRQIQIDQQNKTNRKNSQKNRTACHKPEKKPSPPQANRKVSRKNGEKRPEPGSFPTKFIYNF